jgi:short subunit fatty acids transporter
MKTEMPAVRRKPSIPLAVVRVIVMSIVFGLLFLALGLLFGVVGFAIARAIKGSGVNMTHAYRYVAFPLGVVGFVGGLCASIILETRHFRRERAAYDHWKRAA